jgi:hypothetical protein
MTVNNAAAAAGAFNSQFIVFNTHEGGVNEGERMRITSLGNVGIGTFTPLSLLTVGEASSTTAAKGLSFGGDASANLYRSAASTIKTDGSLTVVGGASFGGSVGIGTTTVFSKTTISKTGVSLPTTADNTNNAHLTLAGSDSLVRLQFGTQNVAPFGGWIQSSYDNTAGDNGVEPMLLNPLGGNVGIGVTNPAFKLHVTGANGDEVQLGTIGSNQIVGGRDGGSFGIATKASSNGNMILAANSAMYFRTNTSNESAYIGSNGNFGINTTSPGAKLDVVGTIRASSNILSHKTASYTTSYPGISSFGADTTDSSLTYYDTGKTVPNTEFRGVVWTGKHYIFTDYNNNRAYFYNNNFVQIPNAYGYYFVTLPLPSGYSAPHGAAWDGRYLWCVV